MGGRPIGRTLVLVSVLGLLLLVAVFVAEILATDAEIVTDAQALRLGIPALLLALAGLEGWRRLSADARAQRDAEHEAQRARAEAEEARRERDSAQAEAAEERSDREAAESAAEQARRARERERTHAQELRGQVLQLQRERGPLGRQDDVPHLVLHLAMHMLEARKGLLLSRADEDADGDLDLLAAEGFDADPEHSRIAQRFAREVIEQDTTIREDQPPQELGEADDEIDCLVAIPFYLADRYSGVVVVANRDGGFKEFDDEVLLAIGDHAGAVLQNSRLHGELRSAYVSTIAALVEAIEAKDPFLRGHSEEVSQYVAAVAEQLGVEGEKREELVFASLLHDVGKIGISERILLKPSALSDEEFSVIQLHSRLGARLVEQVPQLRGMAAAILHHHERWDGDGYPARLKGEEIPLEARIICVADSFSAMTAERPYRGRMSLEDACAELERCAGTQFDPKVVRVFIDEVRKDPPGAGEGALARAMSDPEIQARRRAEEPLLGFTAFAVTDNLTLLYSHSYFHEVAQAEAERAAIQERPFGVVLAELEGIEEINRRDGFAAGDAAIRALARAFQRAAVRTAGTAARHAGHRLALLCPNSDEESTARHAADLAADAGSELSLRVASAAWRPGDSGDAVIARARADLAQPAARSSAASSRA